MRAGEVLSCFLAAQAALAGPGVAVAVSRATDVSPEDALRLTEALAAALVKGEVAVKLTPAALSAAQRAQVEACAADRDCLAQVARQWEAGALVAVEVGELLGERAVYVQAVEASTGQRLVERSVVLGAGVPVPSDQELASFVAALRGLQTGWGVEARPAAPVMLEFAMLEDAPRAPSPFAVVLAVSALVDPLTRRGGVAAAVGAAHHGKELLLRVVPGSSATALGLELGYLFGSYRVRPRASVRGTWLSNLGLLGVGPGVGARVEVGSVFFAAEVGLDLLAGPTVGTGHGQVQLFGLAGAGARFALGE